MPIPGLATDFPVPPARGPLAIKGQVRVRSGENDAEVVGITIGPGTFGSAPPNIFLGNIVNETDPVRPWDWATFAGVGLTYTVSALGANFVDLKGRDVQAWSVAATTQSWNYPPDLSDEDMILVAVHTGGLTTHSTPALWTLVGSQATSSSRLSVYKRIIDGTEGLTESFTLGTAAGGLIHTWTFDRAHGDVEVTAALNDSPAGTSLDIGAVSPTWASGGATNTYYIALLGLDVESGSTVSVFPTSYTDTTQNSIASGTASIDCRTAYAERKVSGTTEDPSAFTYGAARAAGFIIAIRGKDAGQLDATGGGAAGWDDVLANDPHSGVNNPIVDTGQFIQFGTTAGGIVTGQARTNNNFLFSAASQWKVDAGEDIQLVAFDGSLFRVTAGGLTLRSFDGLDIQSDDSFVSVDALTNITMTSGGDMTFTPSGFLHMGSSTLTNDIALQANGIIDINSATDIIAMQSSTGMNMITATGSIAMQSPLVHILTGFLKINEVAASTPSMSAGQALFWVKNDAPNNPFFTDDTNVDRQIATFPIPLTGLASQAADTFVGRLAGAGVPTAQLLSDIDSTSLIYDATSHTFQLGAHTGDVTSTQNSLALTIAADAVTNTKLANMAAKSVKANATNATADPSDLAGSVAFQHLRVNAANTGLEWSVFTAGDFPTNVVPITGLATIAAKSVLANATNATASVTAVAGSAAFQYLRVNAGNTALEWGTLVVTNAELATMPANTIKANATAGVAVPTDVAVAAESVFGRTSGNLQGIASSVQSVLMRGAGSVFWGTAAADQVFRRSGSGDLGFGTLVTNNIGDDQVTNAKLAQMAAHTFKANATGSTADPTDASLVTLAGEALDYNNAGALDYVGSTTIITSVTTTGALGVVDISTLRCGGTVSFQGLTDATIDGFTAKPDGFWFHLCVRDVTTTDYLTVLENVGNTTTSVRTPGTRNLPLTKAEGVILVYHATRWRIADSVAKLWMVSADSLTWNTIQNNVTRTSPGISVIRADVTGDTSLTGIVPNANGEIVALHNVNNSFTLMIEDEGTTSTTTNRFDLKGDYMLGPKQSALFWYDGTVSRWKMFGHPMTQQRVAEALFTPSTQSYTHIVWTDEDFSSNAFRGNSGGSFFNIWAEGTNGGYWNGVTISGGTATITRVDNTIGHNGIADLATSATNGMSCALLFTRDVVSVATNEAVLDLDHVVSMDMYVRIPTITSVSLFCGLFNDAVPANVTDGVYFQFIAGNANWRSVTELASTQTDTSISTVTAGNWYKLSIVRATSTTTTAPQWDFYINNVRSATRHTANIFQGGVVPAIVLRTDSAAIRTAQVDRIRICVNDAAMFT